jgi:hypothetical protein
MTEDEVEWTPTAVGVEEDGPMVIVDGVARDHHVNATLLQGVGRTYRVLGFRIGGHQMTGSR